MKKQKSALKVKDYRYQIEHYLVEKNNWQYYSSVIYNHWQLVFEELLPNYIHGTVIDVGCGNAPYLHEIQKYSKDITLMDVSFQDMPIAFLGSLESIPLSSCSFDSVLCFQVFEHIPDPFAAILEISRIMKPGGVLFLSVPHLSRLHDVPYDYFRYTEFGIRHLLHIADMEILDLRITDGLISFLGHQISVSFTVLLWKVKFLRKIGLLVNKWILTRFITWLDRLIGLRTYFPQGYAIVARKR